MRIGQPPLYDAGQFNKVMGGMGTYACPCLFCSGLAALAAGSAEHPNATGMSTCPCTQTLSDDRVRLDLDLRRAVDQLGNLDDRGRRADLGEDLAVDARDLLPLGHVG